MAAVLGRDRLPGQALDVAQQIALLRVAKRDGDARGAGACRAADAVDIALRHVRQLEVDDVRHQVDVDAARGDVGGNQRPDLRGAKGRQRLLALRLALVAVDGGDADAGRLEMTGDLGRRRAWCA